MAWRGIGPNRWETGPGAGSVGGESKSTIRRVSGGPGVFGTWRISAIEGALEIRSAGNGVLFRWVGYAEATCQFDGQECPLSGSVPAGSTMTLRETGPRTFEYQDKTKGKINYTSRFTLSEDGKTLIEDEMQATGEKRRIVYERQ